MLRIFTEFRRTRARACPSLSFVLLLASVGPSIVKAAAIHQDYAVDDAVPLDLCTSPIYCNGDLLKTVQLAGVYKDSKTFVDLFQLHDEEVTLDNFQKLMTATGQNPNKTLVENFVKENFAPKDELVSATLKDWSPNPEIISRIRDPHYKNWAKSLNEIWKNLARHMDADVRVNPKRHSLIYVDNTFIIPGGRFKEFYYWDSYWVIEGLLLTGMNETVKGIIENFLSMVNVYGFVPNGGRVYYLMRSQPPLLLPMVDLYYEHTKDWNFVAQILPTLEKEFKFFQRYKTTQVIKNGRNYTMARYITSSDGPRPESYREDYALAQGITDESKKRAFYKDVKAGAESGWDFSARWFINKNGEFSTNISDMSTSNIIPVDLNSFMERNARLLVKFHSIKRDAVKVKYYLGIAKEYQDGINNVLWNEEDGIWYDYNLLNGTPRKHFYPSNLTPLYTKSFNPSRDKIYGERVMQYLRKRKISNFMGGTPTSLENTTQQWDFPNAWPPLQSVMVQGLRNTNYPPALSLAKNLAIRWLRSNFMGFLSEKKMFEKYDAMHPGKYGGGGEYEVQDGFGWTNGVVFEFLDAYPTATSSDGTNA